MEAPQIKSIVCAFQKLMQQKGFSTQTQWDELAMMPTKILSKSAFLQRLSSYGLDLTDDEVNSFWDYFNLRPRSISYEDFEKIMKKTFPAQQQVDFQVPSNYNQSRPSTTATQRSYPTRNAIQHPAQQERLIDSQQQIQTATQNNEQTMMRKTRNYDYSDDDDQKGHSYYLSRSIKQKETNALPISDLKTFDSLSNSSIQRQKYDGPLTDRKSFRTRNSLKKTLATISDAAYACEPNSWNCFLKWRDPTKDTIDASDLVSALSRDANVHLNLADVQKVIDTYGPLNQHTFKLVLTDGHRYSMRGDFNDDTGF